MAGYQKGTPELRERAFGVLREHGGAMQNHELAKIALAEGWPISHAKMWGTHGLLNTLREEGRVVRVGRGRYAIAGSEEAQAAEITHRSDWDSARKRIVATTLSTVAQSGQTATRILKNKELRCANLNSTLDELAERQNFRCAQTGVLFDEADTDLRASLDRIDSDGHYQDGSILDDANNLQLVTHWYNMAKGTRSDAVMRRLLELHSASPPRSRSA